MIPPPTSRPRSRRAPRGRVAVAVLAVGGLAASVVASTSGAVTSHATKSVVISTLKTSQFGTILVSGKALYTLKPSATACGSKCLKYWPEVVLPKGVAKATPGPGVTAAKLGIVKRPGGVRQVTYGGKPLYWFSGDTAPGQVTGVVTDTWGAWSVVVTAQSAKSSPPPPSPTTTPSSTSTSTTTTKPPTTTTSPGSGGIAF